MSFADDARALAIQSRNERVRGKVSMARLDKTLLRIRSAAERGEFECKAPNFFFRPLNEAEQDVIREHGFKVWVGCASGNVYIEWKESR